MGKPLLSPSKGMRWLFIALQIIVFGVLIYFLFRSFEFSLFFDAVAQSQKSVLMLVFITFLFREVFFGLRWWNSVRLFDEILPLSYYIKNSFIIKFFDYTLPLPAADDFYKVVLLKMKNLPLSKAFASTILDKIFGFLLLAVLFFFSLPLLFNQAFLSDNQLYLIILLLVIFILPMTLLAAKPSLLMNSILWLGKTLFPKRYGHFQDEAIQYHQSQQDRAKLIVQLLVVIGYNVVLASMIYFLFHALNASLDYTSILVCIPLFTFAVLLPLSYQGLGLYEAAMVFVFINFFDVNPLVAQSIGILHFAFSLVVYALGGLFAIPHFREYIRFFRTSFGLNPQ